MATKEDPTITFDRSLYSVRTWKSPIMLFWASNPLVTITEFFLGQRAPKTILIGKGKEGARKGVGYVPCPHCGTIHSGLEWSRQNHTLYKNWFGLYCKDCGNIIPCLYSLGSYLLLGLTFPIWYGFKDKWKARWLEKQRARFSTPLNLEPPTFTWWKVGLGWGLWMYVAMALLFPWFYGDEITMRKLLFGIPYWIVFGLLFGLFMRYSRKRMLRRNSASDPS